MATYRLTAGLPGFRCRSISHPRLEAVPAPRNGLNVALVSKSLAQGRNILSEAVLLDEGIGPHKFEEFRLLNQLALPFDQNRQRVEGLRREWNGFSCPEEQALFEIQLEEPES